jgi:hypothetical protein
VLKWLYFALVAAFLGALLWMINDMRLKVTGMVERLDRQLPPLLDNAELAAKRVNKQLPSIMQNSEQAASDINTHLPKLLKTGQQAVDRLDTLAKSFRQFSDSFARRRAPAGNRDRRAIAGARPAGDEGQDSLTGVPIGLFPAEARY